MPAAAVTIAWFRAAASYLSRGDLRCRAHRVAHTGKLARAAVLDLALHDATGEDRHWRRAVERARYVASRLAPDPEHGGLIYLPGRFDPRNCSNSVIDSGECTDALGRVLLHPRAGELDAPTREPILSAVMGNAETYLRTAVVEKEITNQRLWGAMGLATAWQVEQRDSWREALRESLSRSIAEQRADGSWGYQPDAPRYGAHPGAADLTVYYHGRCLAFLMHVLERVRGVDPSGDAERGLKRGLEFLTAVTLPDGTKPLALEGKRWFWDGNYEAGSNAYDVFSLVRGAQRFGVPEWADLAQRSWRTLAHHQQPDGRIEATHDPGAHNFVCADFHTADLAWTAQVMGELPTVSEMAVGGAAANLARGLVPRPASPAGETPALPVPASALDGRGLALSRFADAGVVRLEAGPRIALIRTHKLPANTQFGGAYGGGAIAAVASCDAEGPFAPRDLDGCFLLTSRRTVRGALAGVRRFLKNNPPGREGRQWLFVARLLATQRRPLAAWRRLWRGYVQPLTRSPHDQASNSWALESDVREDGGVLTIAAVPARLDGSQPGWAGGVRVVRRLELVETGLLVRDRLESSGGASRSVRVQYVIPASARDVEVNAEGLSVNRAGAAGYQLSGQLGSVPCALVVSYSL